MNDRRAVQAVFWRNGSPVLPDPEYVADIMHRYELDHTESWVADIVVQEIERTGREAAFACVDRDGNGPLCSFCENLWGLCEHAYWAQKADEERVVVEAQRALTDSVGGEK